MAVLGSCCACDLWVAGVGCATGAAVSHAVAGMRMPLTPCLVCLPALLASALPCLSPCSAKYAPELSGEEVKAALEVLDTNKDGNIQLGEFVEWWVATGGPSASA